MAKKISHPIPGGGTGKNSAWMFRGEDGYKSLKERAEASKAYKAQRRLTALQKTGDSRVANNAINSVFGRPENAGNEQSQTGTSIFDPVLCELAYRWFCPPGGRVLDPFAGGSVRGIVAAILGRDYVGIDLRPEQVEANRQQAVAITPDRLPIWVVGDSRNLKGLASGDYDLLFSCPPYYDLEVYSDNAADLSNAESYEEFDTVHCAIIQRAIDMLKPDRFAIWVVGDCRDKAGFFRDLPGDTVSAFRQAGLGLLNRAVFVQPVGSLPIRISGQFESGRKLGKTHQYMFVFCKGDPRKATQAVGKVDVSWFDCAVTLQRWADMTGQEPVLVGN